MVIELQNSDKDNFDIFCIVEMKKKKYKDLIQIISIRIKDYQDYFLFICS